MWREGEGVDRRKEPAGICTEGAENPEGSSTQYLRSLVPKTIPLMVFGTKGLKYMVLGPFGSFKGP